MSFRWLVGLLALFQLSFAPAALADGLDDVLERGSLRVGVSLFTPWTLETEDGLRGFEVDIGNQLARDLGVEADFRVYAWNDLIPALEAGEIDVIAAGMSITPARALRVDFSNSYSSSGGVTVAANLDLTGEMQRFGELNSEDVVLTAVEGTISVEFAQDMFPEADLRTLPTSAEAGALVVGGEAHAYIGSVPEARFLSLRHPETIELPLAEPLVDSVAGFAVQRGNTGLLNWLNAWIAAHQADRWLDAQIYHWFYSLEWADEVE